MSPEFLRAIRKKHGLGEFRKGKKISGKRKSPKPTTRRRQSGPFSGGSNAVPFDPRTGGSQAPVVGGEVDYGGYEPGLPPVRDSAP